MSFLFDLYEIDGIIHRILAFIQLVAIDFVCKIHLWHRGVDRLLAHPMYKADSLLFIDSIHRVKSMYSEEL